MSENPKISASAKLSAKVTASNAEVEFQTPEEFRNWLQDELRFAKAYWEQRIQPYIKDRKLQYFEYEVAQQAYSRVEDTAANARKWNAGKWPMGANKFNGDDGEKFPIPEAELPEREQFCKPELFRVDKTLKPEILAGIAAQTIANQLSDLSPSERVRIAHELLIAEQDYLDTLKKPQEKRAASLLFSRQIKISFDEIEESNKKESGQLPLLSPDRMNQNGGQMTRSAIRAAVRRYYEKRTDLSPEERTAAKIECLQNNQIPLSDLCKMRLDRFKRYWQKQQMAGLKLQIKLHQQSNSEKAIAKIPNSAGSSLPTAGIPENRKKSRQIKF